MSRFTKKIHEIFSKNLDWVKYGSLARRILFICLALLIIPLILFALFLADIEKELQEREQKVQLVLVGKAISSLVQEWIDLKKDNLKLLSNLVQSRPNRNAVLGEFAQTSTLFLIEKGVYLASNDSSLVGQTVPAFSLKKLQIIPLLPGRELSLVFLQDSIGIAMDARTWLQSLAQLKDAEIPFSLQAMDEQGRVLLSTHLEEFPESSYTITAPEWNFSLLLSLPSGTLKQERGIRLINHLLRIFLFFLFIGGGVVFWLTQRMARPLKQLHTVMDRVELGEVAARYEKDSLGFEINEIGRHFNHTLQTLLEQRVAKERLTQELIIGQEIQKSLFPKEIPHVSGLEVAAGFLPAREVAGDFYDLFLKNENQLLIAIADASDKGISACLYSLLFRSLLRSQVQVQESLSEALYQANLLFCQDTGETGNFATAWVGLYDIATKELLYCNGGHPPPLLIHADGKFTELDHGMGAFGVRELVGKPVVQTIALAKGDVLVLVTDGILEAENAEGVLFGKQSLYDFVIRYKEKTPREIVDLLLQEVDRFSRGAVRSDDLTILSIRID